MNKLYTAFDKQKYLNLETFRKSGVGVKTPVWFVQEGEVLYVRTIADSYKAKRIRINPQVNIAPCKMDGKLLGDWIHAEAHEVSGEEIDRKVDRLLDKKYGLMKKLFTMAGGRDGRNNTIIELKVRE
jgi:PPOX class probable F420-dependent enzyme